MFQLRKSDFYKVKFLFRNLDFNIVIPSVINHNTHGDIYVDNTELPHSALIWDKMGEILIAGNPDNAEFNDYLLKLIDNRIKPAVKNFGLPWLDLYFADSFQHKINNLLSHQTTCDVLRYEYKFDQLPAGWLKNKPEGCKLLAIDQSLLQNQNLRNLRYVHDWINSFWPSKNDFLQKGLGFCLIKENVVVSWCLSVFVSSKYYELGLETIYDYRNKGYGKLTAAACLEYCLHNGLIPCWQCEASNIPSHKVAESLGFTQNREYYIKKIKV